MRGYLLVLAACSSSPAKPPEPEKPAAAAEWPVPAGWKSEDIPFPLGFAPDIKHEGVEKLRFPPGFFKVDAPDYFSYAFVWRTKDAAELDAAALGTELTMYFRGLMKAVDEKKQQIKDPMAITASATKQGARFAITAHIFDAFGAGNAVDLEGWAERRACESGALWIVVLAPKTSTIRAELDALAAKATCH
jgi:hypothetical protein